MKISTFFIALNSERFIANQLKLIWYVNCLSASSSLLVLDSILGWSQCLVLEGYFPDNAINDTA